MQSRWLSQDLFLSHKKLKTVRFVSWLGWLIFKPSFVWEKYSPYIDIQDRIQMVPILVLGKFLKGHISVNFYFSELLYHLVSLMSPLTRKLHKTMADSWFNIMDLIPRTLFSVGSLVQNVSQWSRHEVYSTEMDRCLAWERDKVQWGFL